MTIQNDRGETVWESHQASIPRPAVTLRAGGVSGRTVRVQLEGETALYLAEVVVTGRPHR